MPGTPFILLRRRLLPACLVAWLAASTLPAAIAADAVPGRRVQDLYYGESLLHFFADDHYTALANLLVARDLKRVPHHEADSELLLGGLYLHYGQHDRAEQIFKRLLDESVSLPVRDRAWFYLGKVRYQRGLYAEALADFARVQGSLDAAQAAELPMLAAQSQMALNRFDAAAAILDDYEGPDHWAAYARYNLGVAYVRLGRLEDGARQLDRIGRLTTDSAELLALRDKANLALGYAFLQQQLDGQARPVLARIRVNGPYSNKALLAVGWADAARQQYREALTPWLALRDRDLLDSAVQESLLAIPYAYARLGAVGSAAEGYQAALDAFDQEVSRLDETIARARSGGLVPAILRSDDPDIGRWNWELNEVPDAAESRYLYHLIADNAFQEGLRNVRDLEAIEAKLAEWRSSLEVFDEMVDTKRLAYAEREPRVGASLANIDLDRLTAARDALTARLDEARRSGDVSLLGTATELDQWRRLQAVGKDPQLAAGEAGELRERHRLLQGVLLWDMDREFRYRLWQQQRKLASLDKALAEAGRRRDAVLAARTESPAGFDAFSQRIAAAIPRIERLQAAIARIRTRQEGRLQALAVESLTNQRERLAAYRVQAQFSLATIYDRSATGPRAAATVEPSEAGPR